VLAVRPDSWTNVFLPTFFIINLLHAVNLKDAPKYTLNPDMTICKAETGKSAVGSVLVDFTKKNME